MLISKVCRELNTLKKADMIPENEARGVFIIHSYKHRFRLINLCYSGRRPNLLEFPAFDLVESLKFVDCSFDGDSIRTPFLRKRLADFIRMVGMHLYIVLRHDFTSFSLCRLAC